MIKILFFGQLKAQLDCAELTWPWCHDITLAQLRKQLSERGELWQTSLADGRLLAAVNQQMADFEQRLEAGDEVAFFPPVTGG